MAVKVSKVPDYTPKLLALMEQLGFRSFAQLARASGLSKTHINWVRQGRILDLRLHKVLLLSEVLQIDLDSLLATFSPSNSVNLRSYSSKTEAKQPKSVNLRRESVPSDQHYLELQHKELQQKIATLQQEYQRQQQQQEEQQEQLWVTYQRSTLQALESLLLQWPTAAHAARQHPEAPAIKLLPLLRPLEQLLATWGIIAIGEVGARTVYDPQWHQIMNASGQPLSGQPKAGDPVLIRYVGYRQGEQLLYRAKVSST